jgi:alkanesulfonate monooxygenase SsuD/methylene tetrahydromethanopterin reductase-like flavin-dependent oxidoreductase (luciferase family)
LVENGAAPTFGLWYDFRQRLPLGDYARFYAECLEEIEEGERLGFTGAWLSEHPLRGRRLPALPARGRGGRGGPHPDHHHRDEHPAAPMHHPLRVAEDAAAVDLVSGGRFVLGVGQGYVQHEFETLGYERRYRPSLFEEGIEVIRRALREGRTGYEGKRWRFGDLPFEPRPSGKLPIYAGAFADPAIDRAARLADGFLASTGAGRSDRRTGRSARRWSGTAGAARRFPYVASGVAFVHEEAGRAREIVGPAIAYQRTRYAEWGTDREEPRPEPVREEDLPWERYLVGTPEEVAEGLIGLYREAPYDHFCFWGRLPGVTHEQALENLRLFATEVAPRVREAAGAEPA